MTVSGFNRSPSHNSRLGSYKKISKVLHFYTRTKRYCSFVQYALSHYQDRLYGRVAVMWPLSAVCVGSLCPC